MCLMWFKKPVTRQEQYISLGATRQMRRTMNTPPPVILLTDVFPNFVAGEYDFLKASGADVRVYAHRNDDTAGRGPVILFGTPAGFKAKALLFFFFSGEFFRVLRFGKRMLQAARIAVNWAATAFYVCSVVEKKEPGIAGKMLYAYWGDTLGLAVAMLSRRRGVKSLARMHGWDLYENRHALPYLPYRRFLNKHLNRIVFISEHGMEHYAKKYPTVRTKLSVSRLGTPDPLPKHVTETTGFHMVSCSYLVPVKRPELLLRLMETQKETDVKWTHLGDGPLFEQMGQKVENLGLAHSVTLKGHMENADIHRYYAETHIDVFINVSESEGLPVSVMEAMSYGIPVIATAVGGTPEIVRDGNNGFLLGPDPTVDDIAEALKKFRNLPAEERIRMSKNAFATWQEGYSAEKNNRSFTEQLKTSAKT